MILSITKISSWSCKRLEESLLPVDGPLVKKIKAYSLHFFQFCVFLPTAIFSSTLDFFLRRQGADSPLIAFAKRPQWSDTPVKQAPVEIGFATADFQENGYEEHPDTNWGQCYLKHPEKFKLDQQMPDMWNHPERLIAKLKEVGVKKFRFSVSRDKVEPKLGKMDKSAILHYQRFCRRLIAEGIEPMVTLHHFTDPLFLILIGKKKRESKGL